MEKTKIVKLHKTTGAFPTQWEGETSDGRAVYVRYRGGCLDVGVGKDADEAVRATLGLWKGERLIGQAVDGEDGDGVMFLQELIRVTANALDVQLDPGGFKTMRLRPGAQSQRDDFNKMLAECKCEDARHLGCDYHTHPGNMVNQLDPEFWEDCLPSDPKAQWFELEMGAWWPCHPKDVFLGGGAMLVYEVAENCVYMSKA